ncbi:CST complex subunit STN1-like isoform X2 [Tachypleus tridentatus]|uniref:CST complex subunit STN1-like isoform X2 n=1 Tax=Tachypleus tridentatus TaxID=6853 RepID=UPI003FD3A457
MDDDSQTCVEYTQKNKNPAFSLDYLKTCHMKLFIHDIHSFYLQCIDDGTGIITCFQNKQNQNSRSVVFSHQETKLESLESVFEVDIRDNIREFWKNLEEKKRTSITPFSLGDVIHVLGSLKTWAGQIYIDIYHSYKVTDPNAEVLRNLELLTLYYHVYKWQTDLC